MQKKLRVRPEELKLTYSEDKFSYDPNINILDTTELIYGQERGIKAFEFGLDMEKKGYNIFFEGPTGVGKTMYVKKYLNKKAIHKEVPKDICYVYNFERSDEPISLEFEAGKGKKFKHDMEKFVDYLKINLKEATSDNELEKKKKNLNKELEDSKKKIIDNLNLKTKPNGFEVVQGPNGVFMLPVYKGKTLEKDEYEKLSAKTKMQYEERSKGVQELIFGALTEIRELELISENKVNTFMNSITEATINVGIEKILNEYKDMEKVSCYLSSVKEDILKNISKLIGKSEVSKQVQGQINPMFNVQDPWFNYGVNLFIDNSHTKGAPVIMDLDYSFENIFGKVEYTNQYGALNTDFTKIKSGLIHKANGGYIVFQALDLLRNPYAYEMLKKVLKLEEIGIENNPEQRLPLLMTTLKPESIKVNIKVILIGNSYIYDNLTMRDPDFSKLFKIKTEFENDAPINRENVDKLSKFVSSYQNQEDLIKFDKSALVKIIEYASKLSGDQNKLTTNFAEIGRLMSEASTWAIRNNKDIVTSEDILVAFKERTERVKKYDKRLSEMIEKDVVKIDTKGYKVGEINGLSVIGSVDTKFGKPTKITANTYLGNGRIINVEKETQMSGEIHTKGMAILEGYIGEKYSQDIPLSMTASITFEQVYSKVDGDSASSTEIYVLLSSLSELPINQGIAVTGSVNQKGEIQPIGGVNEKINGFYEICKIKGLDGTQGVMIPKQNVYNLHLPEEIVEAVKNNKFNIYAVSTIDEGIELLTGVPAGKLQKDGKFAKGTINYLVVEKLKKYHEQKKKLMKLEEEKPKEKIKDNK